MGRRKRSGRVRPVWLGMRGDRRNRQENPRLSDAALRGPVFPWPFSGRRQTIPRPVPGTQVPIHAAKLFPQDLAIDLAPPTR